MKNLVLILIFIVTITIQPSFASKYATLHLKNNSQVIFQEFDSNDDSIINAVRRLGETQQ